MKGKQAFKFSAVSALIIFFAFIQNLLYAQPGPASLFGQWVCTDFRTTTTGLTEGEKAHARTSRIGKNYYIFFPDSVYEAEILGLKHRGNWNLTDKVLELTAMGFTNDYSIEKLSEDTLIVKTSYLDFITFHKTDTFKTTYFHKPINFNSELDGPVDLNMLLKKWYFTGEENALADDGSNLMQFLQKNDWYELSADSSYKLYSGEDLQETGTWILDRSNNSITFEYDFTRRRKHRYSFIILKLSATELVLKSGNAAIKRTYISSISGNKD
jgi:hypothetical protein